MKFPSVLFVLSILTFSTALPVFRSRAINGLVLRQGKPTSALYGNSTTSALSAPSKSPGTTKPPTAINVEGANENAAATKETSSSVTADQVQSAVSGFAKDANTVSGVLNILPSVTNPLQIGALATAAFNAESNEDSQRSVLFAAAGNAGASANAKIVSNTPAVLNGLKAMMTSPSVFSVKANVAPIEAARNPNILPSITELSNAALSAMNLSPTAQTFPATGQNRRAAFGGFA
ncbi:hypothetical protein NHQ30_009576 [Ciborinia camelliae]|nr:hypothetical protein NHQ30_009576 [Ciborinia camelliae]